MLAKIANNFKLINTLQIFLMSFIVNTPQFPGLNAIPKTTWGSFRGQRGKNGGNFGVGIISGSILGIISGLGIISWSGSFRGLYRSLSLRANTPNVSFC